MLDDTTKSLFTIRVEISKRWIVNYYFTEMDAVKCKKAGIPCGMPALKV